MPGSAHIGKHELKIITEPFELKDCAAAMVDNTVWSDRLTCSVPSFACRVFGSVLLDDLFLTDNTKGRVVSFRKPLPGERLNTYIVYVSPACKSKHETVFGLMKQVSSMPTGQRKTTVRFVVIEDFAEARKSLASTKDGIKCTKWVCSSSEKRDLIEAMSISLGTDAKSVEFHRAVCLMQDLIATLGFVDRDATLRVRSGRFSV